MILNNIIYCYMISALEISKFDSNFIGNMHYNCLKDALNIKEKVLIH